MSKFKSNYYLDQDLDTETGELTNPSVRKSSKYQPDKYYRVVTTQIANIQNISPSSLIFFFSYLCPKMGVNNSLHITGGFIRDCKKDTGWSESRIRQLIHGCLQEWLLLKIDTGSYLCNPKIVYKGYDSNRVIMIEDIRSGKINVMPVLDMNEKSAFMLVRLNGWKWKKRKVKIET